MLSSSTSRRQRKSTLSKICLISTRTRLLRPFLEKTSLMFPTSPLLSSHLTRRTTSWLTATLSLPPFTLESRRCSRPSILTEVASLILKSSRRYLRNLERSSTSPRSTSASETWTRTRTERSPTTSSPSGGSLEDRPSLPE